MPDDEPAEVSCPGCDAYLTPDNELTDCEFCGETCCNFCVAEHESGCDDDDEWEDEEPEPEHDDPGQQRIDL